MTVNGIGGTSVRMRVATWNILHARSPADGRVDLDRFQQAIASLDADVLALQEVDFHQGRSGRADLVTLAAEAMGSVEHRFAAAMHGSADDDWRPAREGEPPGTPAYGVALLSRVPVLDWHLLALPRPRWPVPFRYPGETLPSLVQEEPRRALAARVVAPWGPVTVVGTHLSFVPLTNGRQLRLLRRSLGVLPSPRLLLGDLNMGPARAERITGMRCLVGGTTFPADRPRWQLDHVLADDAAWSVSRPEARELPLSDHRALVVDLTHRPL